MKTFGIINSLAAVLAAPIVATAIASSSAHADTYWHCKGDECLGVTEDHPSPPALGTYDNPIPDVIAGDLSGPIHRGMYCVRGEWHQGWLRRGERSPVIKPSCGDAVYQMPH
jgi:hypothetical protein